MALCLSEKHFSDVELFLSFLFLSHKNDSHLSWWGIPNILNQSVVRGALFPWWRELMRSKCRHQSLQQLLPVLISAFCFIHNHICMLHLNMLPAFKMQVQRKIFPVSLSNNPTCRECLITVQGSLSCYLKIPHKPNKNKIKPALAASCLVPRWISFI